MRLHLISHQAPPPHHLSNTEEAKQLYALEPRFGKRSPPDLTQPINIGELHHLSDQLIRLRSDPCHRLPRLHKLFSSRGRHPLLQVHYH
jgi:hypothetical protein